VAENVVKQHAVKSVPSELET